MDNDHSSVESESEEVDVVDDEVPLDEVVRNSKKDTTRIKLLSRRIFSECRKCLGANPTKILGCLHVFCENCIEAMKNEQQNGKLLCNACQCLTPISLIAENCFKQLIESKPIQRNKTNVCQSCEDNRPAYKYCLECKDWLCQACTAAHERVKITKSHNLTEEIDNVETERRMCSRHPTEELSLYCHQCRMLTCRDCQLESHAGHKYDYLCKAAEVSSVILAEKLDEIRSKRSRLKIFHDQAKKRKVELGKKRKLIETDIHKKFDHIIEALQEKRGHFIDRVNGSFASKERQLMIKQEETVRLLRAIEHAEQFVSCVEHIDRKESTVHTVALSGDYFRLILRNSTTTLDRSNVDVKLKRNLNHSLRTFLHNLDITVHDFNEPQPARTPSPKTEPGSSLLSSPPLLCSSVIKNSK